MKKLLALLLILFGFTKYSSASHVSGGELTYYADTNSSNPLSYVVELKLYRRNSSSSAGLPSSITIQVASSCYSNMSLNATRQSPAPGYGAGDGGHHISNYFSCISFNSPSFSPTSVHKYKAHVTLPGKCSDFRFWFQLCCRAGNISNGPANQRFYIDANLNNMLDPNTSPKFRYAPFMAHCIGQQAFAHYGAVEPDGDSIYYSFSDPLSAYNSVAIFDTGYSATNPYTTLNGVFLDSTNGMVSFIPTAVEYDISKVQVVEYRKDSANQWHLIGAISREIPVLMTATCNPNMQYWSLTKDSLGIDTTAIIPCHDSTIVLKTSSMILTSSIAIDGSDFVITDKYGDTLSILSAKPNAKYLGNLICNEIKIEVATPFKGDQVLTVYMQKGTDGNTLTNACYFELAENSSSKVAVTACPFGVSIAEDYINTNFSLYPNPAANYINLKSTIDGNVELKIYNETGAEIKSWRQDLETSAENKIDISGLHAGLYWLEIGGDHLTRLKFIKN